MCNMWLSSNKKSKLSKHVTNIVVCETVCDLLIVSTVSPCVLFTVWRSVQFTPDQETSSIGSDDLYNYKHHVSTHPSYWSCPWTIICTAVSVVNIMGDPFNIGLMTLGHMSCHKFGIRIEILNSCCFQTNIDKIIVFLSFTFWHIYLFSVLRKTKGKISFSW